VSAAKKLTLSFDNGPAPDVTPGVLDVLARSGVGAAFFVCGKDARSNVQRAILERAKREGHRIGNHTLTHSVELGTTVDPEAPRREIGLAQEALGELADEDRLFRPYGGGGVLGPRLLSPGAVGFLLAGGYTCVLWNSVPRDWEDVRGWPERALRDVRARDWTLVVLHDLPTGAMRELPRFLDLVREEGVEIVQAFPPDCVPILRGEVVRALDALLPASAGA
jgi:peptidoglycan/xylan/chitin deacetylase (PgdA/CDA1 family)